MTYSLATTKSRLFAALAFVTTAVVAVCHAAVCHAADEAPTPKIASDWWTIAGDPDLGDCTTERQQPVDFGIWQADDGTWQLWSCIRHTDVGGRTRLFHGWEGKRLTQSDWTPGGIMMKADPKYGETEGGLQAPHVITRGDRFLMFYGDWLHICLATSDDGKRFTREVDRCGRPQLFTQDDASRPGHEYTNTRDAMVIEIEGSYYCYYTAYPERQGSVYCRIARDDSLKTWSDAYVVAHGGEAGRNPYSAECPHVVRRHGRFYLFRTQRYGEGNITRVYASDDPLDFGVEDSSANVTGDEKLIGSLPVAAPEIIRHDGQDYIASLLPSLKGIRMARLGWSEAE